MNGCEQVSAANQHYHECVSHLVEWNLIYAFSTTIALPQPEEENSPTTLLEQESNGNGGGAINCTNVALCIVVV